MIHQYFFYSYLLASGLIKRFQQFKSWTWESPCPSWRGIEQNYDNFQLGGIAYWCTLASYVFHPLTQSRRLNNLLGDTKKDIHGCLEYSDKIWKLKP